MTPKHSQSFFLFATAYFLSFFYRSAIVFKKKIRVCLKWVVVWDFPCKPLDVVVTSSDNSSEEAIAFKINFLCQYK